MKQLHLVGFTTDHKGLIFGTRRGNQEGSYVVTLDQELVEQIEELLRLQASEGVAGIVSIASGNGSAPLLRRPKAESRLTPREVQALLRSGRSVTEIAETAGMSEDWVGRFAPPVQAEQARVVARAVVLTYSKPRLGPSTQPLGESVSWNLADRGVVLSGGALDDAWSAFQQPDGGWVVRVSYLSERRRQHADWTIDMAQGVLKAVNRLGNELGYIEPGRRRPPSLPPVTPASAAAQRAAAIPPKLTPPPPLPARATGRVSLLGSGTPGRHGPPAPSLAGDRRSGGPQPAMARQPPEQARAETDVVGPPEWLSSATPTPTAKVPSESSSGTEAAPSRPTWRAELESPPVRPAPRQRRARPLIPRSAEGARDTPAPFSPAASDPPEGRARRSEALSEASAPTAEAPRAVRSVAAVRVATELAPETESEPGASGHGASGAEASGHGASGPEGSGAEGSGAEASRAEASRAGAFRAGISGARTPATRAARVAAAQARAARVAAAQRAASVPAAAPQGAEPAPVVAEQAAPSPPAAPAARRERPLRAPSTIRRDELTAAPPVSRRPLVPPPTAAPSVVPVKSDRAADAVVRPATGVRRSAVRSSADRKASAAERFGLSRDRTAAASPDNVPRSRRVQNGGSDREESSEPDRPARAPFERRVRPSRPLRSRGAGTGVEGFSPPAHEPAQETQPGGEGQEYDQADAAYAADGPITAPVPAIDGEGHGGIFDSVGEVNGEVGPERDQVLIRTGQAGAPEPVAEPIAGKDRSAPGERHGRASRLRLRRRPQAPT